MLLLLPPPPPSTLPPYPLYPSNLKCNKIKKCKEWMLLTRGSYSGVLNIIKNKTQTNFAFFLTIKTVILFYIILLISLVKKIMFD